MFFKYDCINIDAFEISIKELPHDGHLSITKAIKNVYGKDKVLQQECLIHHKRNVINKIEKRINKEPLGTKYGKCILPKLKRSLRGSTKK